MGNELKPLGWLHYCLNVADIEKSCDFYEKIGFVQVDGDRSQGWAIMHNAGTELALYSGHGEEGATTLNFRGANIDELAARVRELGFAFHTEPKTNGQGSGSFMLDDPAGNIVPQVGESGEKKNDQQQSVKNGIDHYKDPQKHDQRQGFVQ